MQAAAPSPAWSGSCCAGTAQRARWAAGQAITSSRSPASNPVVQPAAHRDQEVQQDDSAIWLAVGPAAAHLGGRGAALAGSAPGGWALAGRPARELRARVAGARSWRVAGTPARGCRPQRGWPAGQLGWLVRGARPGRGAVVRSGWRHVAPGGSPKPGTGDPPYAGGAGCRSPRRVALGEWSGLVPKPGRAIRRMPGRAECRSPPGWRGGLRGGTGYGSPAGTGDLKPGTGPLRGGSGRAVGRPGPGPERRGKVRARRAGGPGQGRNRPGQRGRVVAW
jgi:hypothetical protein